MKEKNQHGSCSVSGKKKQTVIKFMDSEEAYDKFNIYDSWKTAHALCGA